MEKEITLNGKTYVLKEDKHKKETNFKIGDWICEASVQNPILQCVKITRIREKHYDFVGIVMNKWKERDVSIWWVDKNCRLATPEEIESYLTEKAKRRGFKKGVKCFNIHGGIFDIRSDTFYYDRNLDMLEINSIFIYQQGKWAEIIEEETIKIGSYKVDFEEDSIRVGCKTFLTKDIKTVESMIECILHLGMFITFHEDGSLTVGGDGASDYEISNDKFNKILNKLK